MCFQIDEKVAPWKTRYVYKVVRKYGKFRKKFLSEVYTFEYEIGKMYELSELAQTELLYLSWKGGESRQGFYVYRYLRTARRRANLKNMIVIKLRVDQEDFLYSNKSADVATYRKVTVVGRVK